MLIFRGVRVYHHPKGTNVLENPSGLGPRWFTTDHPLRWFRIGEILWPNKARFEWKGYTPSVSQNMGDICKKSTIVWRIFVDFVAQLPMFFFSLARQNPSPAAKTSLDLNRNCCKDQTEKALEQFRTLGPFHFFPSEQQKLKTPWLWQDCTGHEALYVLSSYTRWARA